jgi:hypothetical protein
MIALCLSLVLLSASARSQPTLCDTSLIHRWKFSATCDTPSTSLDGTINIVFDSGTVVIGGLHMGEKVLPFHGRHFASRFIARTDPNHFPVIRMDLTPDSNYRSMSGAMQISKVQAKEPRKKAKDYYNLIYQTYAIKDTR